MDERIRELFEVNLQDIASALGLPVAAARRPLLRFLAGVPARRFAKEMAAFDTDVDRRGITAASSSLLARFVSGLFVSGLESIPARGPVLLLSNHPGMTDTLVLLASLPRDDLLVLAADRPFLRALPAACRSLILLPDDKGLRTAAVRRAVAHLRGGGALLTFPAGEIEPDPEVLPGGVEALAGWSESSMAFVRLAPGCAVVPLIVSGVLEPRAQRNLLVLLLRRNEPDRQRLAAMLQVLVHTLRPRHWRTRVRLQVLPAVPGSALLARGTDAGCLITEAVASRLRARA